MEDLEMNNIHINSVKEFKIFANTYIYPETAHIIVASIDEYCKPNKIEYESLPQATIKFCENNKNIDNLSNYTCIIHDKLKRIFIEYYNNPAVVSLIKNKIHTEIQDENLKAILRSAVTEIQYGNPMYLAILFNITILRDGNIYLYL
jgi:hypothetical protein